MKNKKVIDTLNTILPSNDEKEKILLNILNNSKNKKSVNFNLNFTLRITALASCFCLIFFFSKDYNNKEQLNPNMRIAPSSISDYDIDKFSYNNITYERIDEIFDLDNSKGKLLFVIDDTENPYFGAEIYENKLNNNTVLIYINGIYKQYKINK